MKDLASRISINQSVAPAAYTADAAGNGVDLQGFDAACIVFDPGAITDGTHTPKVQESDDNATFTDVAAADLHGTLVDLGANTPQKIGYKGTRRYLRAFVTVAGATTGGIYGAQVILGHAENRPV